MELNSYLKPILIFPETNSPITPALSFCSHNTCPTCECKAIHELAQEDLLFLFEFLLELLWDFPGGSVVKHSPANSGDMGSILGSERSPGVGNSNPLQYSCLENPVN